MEKQIEELMKNIPEKIYLCIPAEEIQNDFDDIESENVLWSEHREFETDIEYIRSDSHQMLKDVFEELLTTYTDNYAVKQRWRNKAGLTNEG